MAAFFWARFGSCLQTLLDGVFLRAHIAVAPRVARVKHADGCHGFEAFVGLRGFDRITAAAANAEQAQIIGIGALILADKVCSGADVFDAVLRFVGVARATAACALIGGVKSDGDVALFGEFLRVQACDLLFYAAIRMGNDDGGIFFRGVKIGRRIDIGGDFNAGVLLRVFHGVDIDFAFHVLRDGVVVSEGKRVVAVIGGHGVCS